MRAHIMFWLWAAIFLSFTLSNLTEARQEKKHPSAVVVGSVYCDTCFQQSFPKASHFISGALVAVDCAVTNTAPRFRKEVRTNEHGEFRVHLPFSVSKHVEKIKRCSVKLIRSSEPHCAVASTATSSALHLKSSKEGAHVFSAGTFTFKPLKQPELCDQRPSAHNVKTLDSQSSLISDPSDPTFLPPVLREPPATNLHPIGKDLPPLPRLPNLPALPKLPPLPPLPGIPFFPPVSKKTSTIGSADSSESNNQKVAQTQFFGPNPFRPPSLLPPNPFRPLPSVLPPNPFQPPPPILPPPVIPAPPTFLFPPLFPSPPPSIFPPIIPSPPASPPSLFPPIIAQPVPGITPSPLPPPPPVFQFPLPPFPFQPALGGIGPGVPQPASSTSKDVAP